MSGGSGNMWDGQYDAFASPAAYPPPPFSSSFVPWATGLVMDVTSHKLSNSGLSGLQPKSTGGKFAPNNPDILELKRRR